MRSYMLKRVLQGIVTLLGAVTLVFFLARALPGDPVDLMLGEHATAESRIALREALHLDDGLAVQYIRTLSGLSRMDLGTSLRTGRPVREELLRAFPLTLFLGGTALLWACLFAFPFGTLAALRPESRADGFLRLLSTAGLALPSFLVGPLLLLAFAVLLPLFPISGADETGALILPSLTLSVPLGALLSRMVRASILQEAGREYVRTARAKGLGPVRTFVRHALRNAMLPILTLVGLQFGTVLTGAVITEKIFRWPGLGTLILTSIESRDYPVVQGTVLLFAAVYIATNLLTDLAYAWVDPRVHHG